MRKSDIYEFTIKILGIYLVVSLIEYLKEVISYAMLLIQLHGKPEEIGDFDQTPIFIVSLNNLLVMTIFTWLLIFKTRKITNLICTKEDYSETTKLFADKKAIIEIALIIVGLMTIIWTIPEFAIKLKNYVYMSQNNYTTTMNDKSFLLIAGLKIVVGIIAVWYAKSISAYVANEKTQRKENDAE